MWIILLARITESSLHSVCYFIDPSTLFLLSLHLHSSWYINWYCECCFNLAWMCHRPILSLSSSVALLLSLITNEHHKMGVLFSYCGRLPHHSLWLYFTPGTKGLPSEWPVSIPTASLKGIRLRLTKPGLWGLWEGAVKEGTDCRVQRVSLFGPKQLK